MITPHLRAPRFRGLTPRLAAGAVAVVCALAIAASPAVAADESLNVDFSASLGAPTYRGSGWIYGMTENGQNPPDSFYRDVKFRAMRAGGAPMVPRSAGSAKILVGGNRTTGNVAVNLQRLDATSGIVVNNQVRVVVVRNIPYNNGGAVSGPVAVRDSVVTLSNNGTTINVSHSNLNDTSTITLLPPGSGGATNQDASALGTANGTKVQLWQCLNGVNQKWSLRS